MLPFQPGGGGFGKNFVGEGRVGGRGCLGEAMAVEERLASGDREEEEAHCRS